MTGPKTIVSVFTILFFSWKLVPTRAFVASAVTSSSWRLAAVSFLTESETETITSTPTVYPRTKKTWGLPQYLDEMKVGDCFVQESVRVEKVACQPPIFVLRNCLSRSECEEIMQSVPTMETARTLSHWEQDPAIHRKACTVGWVANKEGTRVRSMANQAHAILMPHQVMDARRGVENLQVVHYEEQGEYVLHHDSHQRLLTVLYYLNGAGETWFPLADEHNVPNPKNREEALYFCQDKIPGESGALVSCEGRGIQVQQGDAVAFFSYFSDETRDWKSIHAGMPASSTKWIGNHWYHSFPGSFP